MNAALRARRFKLVIGRLTLIAGLETHPCIYDYDRILLLFYDQSWKTIVGDSYRKVNIDGGI